MYVSEQSRHYIVFCFLCFIILNVCLCIIPGAPSYRCITMTSFSSNFKRMLQQQYEVIGRAGIKLPPLFLHREYQTCCGYQLRSCYCTSSQYQSLFSSLSSLQTIRLRHTLIDSETQNWHRTESTSSTGHCYNNIIIMQVHVPLATPVIAYFYTNHSRLSSVTVNTPVLSTYSHQVSTPSWFSPSL